MKAIIIAAGLGSRLEHYTDERPKCMVDIGGRSILSYQLEAFAKNDIDDIHIVRGYLADKLVVDGATYHENSDYQSNNILLSLFCAASAMDGPFVSTYSDIVYTPQVVEQAVHSPHDIALVVDRQWHLAYEGREDHPPEQAELAEVDGERVLRVGKQVGPENAVGEFIGLARYTAEGARQLREVYADVRAKYGDDEPFQAAAKFRKAYLTDLFCELIDRGVDVGWVPIDGGWREIDTVEDLHRVRDEWAG
ncbi:phosphocholine cytidylyltransferase family protein [Persicimonas caeni]|uniref:Phosphocholine cytidylyltransferase family protein n=1 Tax=Persicimonas caeni TaxID=2292766 RepID=A0A4Y6PVS9_PERCE|nr:phosphocholine cytidylyltransferase family protein [Persicimonas caeni]QDG52461.1 phosphocholine cytidylyltransferase family protein [Persicimonas caeni]QED33683.1 phosphocholine cytidylyltransferase family protein [Persicimonas caeni]